MNNELLAELLFGSLPHSIEQLEEMYPARQLPEGAKVTRMAPSPTGFLHLGNLYGAMADERLAHQSKGVFYLRIEDTDQKREVENGVATILSTFAQFELNFDEGVSAAGDVGAYGPYRQRQRKQIYHICARYLVAQGLAYPCFLSEEEMAATRLKQAEQKQNFGCYGEYACYRDTSLQEVMQLIKSGRPYVVRLKSPGSAENKVKVTDLIRGTLELSENDQDVVLLKADGIPTYHFAHVVDDHFMRTTVVVRGEEWLATLPTHLQLFQLMGWKPPKYLHTAHLMKLEGGSKRKLSKRKDPELSLEFYSRTGYPVQAVKEYLMNLLNSSFEEWRTGNPDAPLDAFPFSAKKMSVSGALFDLEKLNDMARNYISRMSAEQVYREVAVWAQQYDAPFAVLLEKNKDFSTAALAIGRGTAKPRKDITVWSGVKDYIGFFFPDLFLPEYRLPEHISAPLAAEILQKYRGRYSAGHDPSQWFEQIKQLASSIGFAADMKAYKKDPSAYAGNVGDVSMVLRLAVTGREQSPDLYEVMKVMGPSQVVSRLEKAEKAVWK